MGTKWWKFNKVPQVVFIHGTLYNAKIIENKALIFEIFLHYFVLSWKFEISENLFKKFELLVNVWWKKALEKKISDKF